MGTENGSNHHRKFNLHNASQFVVSFTEALPPIISSLVNLHI